MDHNSLTQIGIQMNPTVIRYAKIWLGLVFTRFGTIFQIEYHYVMTNYWLKDKEHCVHIYPTGKWNDAQCDEPRGYICKGPPINKGRQTYELYTNINRMEDVITDNCNYHPFQLPMWTAGHI